jgi:sugar phosphate isomerase/epimerase
MKRLFRASGLLLPLGFSLLLFARADAGPELGLQTWTCRNMTFEQVVNFAAAHGIRQLQLIPAHLNPAEPRESVLKKKALLDRHGLVAYTLGVCPTSTDPAVNRRLFEFARLLGLKLLVVEPKNPAEWDDLEALVREFDIRLAIHNHGRGTVYGDPAAVKRVLAARDPRIGVCLDVGWVTAAGFDAAAVFRDYGDRVFDLHFKDKNAEKADGKLVWLDTEIGRGEANYAGLFAEIRRRKWSGVLAIETDSQAFASDPAPFVTAAQAAFMRYTVPKP